MIDISALRYTLRTPGGLHFDRVYDEDDLPWLADQICRLLGGRPSDTGLVVGTLRTCITAGLLTHEPTRGGLQTRLAWNNAKNTAHDVAGNVSTFPTPTAPAAA